MTRIDIYSLLLAVSGGALVYWAKRHAFFWTNSFNRRSPPTCWLNLLARFSDETLVAWGLGMIGSSQLILLLEYARLWLGAAFVLYVFYLLGREWFGRRK